MGSIVYACFEQFPAPKGAATHVAAFAAALGRAFGEVDLVTLPPAPDAPAFAAPGVRWQPLPGAGPNLIERCAAFRAALAAWWGERRADVVHVRSIYEGYPLARRKAAVCERLVLEVNGLPSIELKYHYPTVAGDAELVAKLRHQEQVCLDAADLVVTPSAVTARHLASRGVAAERLRVIPNGVELGVFSWAPPRLGRREGGPLRLLYAGTLAPWQGVEVAIDALALLAPERSATLTVVGPGRKAQREALRERAFDRGVLDRLELLPPADQAALARLHHAHDVALAPLPADDRNLVQGCCPLKVIEAMATGTPLVASALPVVAALARPDEEAVLVAPGSAEALAAGVRRLADAPGLAERLSRAARARVERELTWERAGGELVDAYRRLARS